jgi:hypothetical protein
MTVDTQSDIPTVTLDPNLNRTLHNGLRVCGCHHPQRHVKPGREDFCVRCDAYLDPRWTSNDDTIQSFYEGVANGFIDGAPEWFQTFRLYCEARERAGRRIFGESYLARDNVREGAEEGCDGANYAFFKTLQLKRAGLDPQMDLALTAAKHFALAYEALAMMDQKAQGRPGEYEPPQASEE